MARLSVVAAVRVIVVAFALAAPLAWFVVTWVTSFTGDTSPRRAP